MITNVIQCVMSSFLPPPRDRLAALCQHWKIRELSVFGSVARGDATADSDIDLLVEYEPDADWSLLDTARLRREFAELFGRPVDLVRERNITNPYRLTSIRRSRRELYAA
jgi:uncharacterized protein